MSADYSEIIKEHKTVRPGAERPCRTGRRAGRARVNCLSRLPIINSHGRLELMGDGFDNFFL